MVYMLRDKKVRLQKNIRIIYCFLTSTFDETKYREIINMNEELQNYLIPTMDFDDINNLIKFVNENKKAVLKEKVRNCGSELCLIEKEDGYYKFTDYRSNSGGQDIFKDDEELRTFLSREREALLHCIVQKNIVPAKIGSTIYDLRITMKKQKDNKWLMNCIECKVGGNNFIINYKSNEHYIAIVTRALEKALPIGCNYRRIFNEINDVCICLCTNIERIDHDLELMGIDIVMDEDTRLWILDVNRAYNAKAFDMLSYYISGTDSKNPLLYTTCLSIL